ncbi:vacuolar iron transporter Ccc1 [Mariannaea sp. PMI_226]|nr:vacuolar iron transporter Ccc1 [Mariannaea sp. PMI_226]
MNQSRSPALTRFLSDFTLGFSDGLTVPFALTAGLSSLGSTDTVISGGLAELCAGSISMGIGGYLAARDELPQSPANGNQILSDVDGDEEMRGMLSFDEASSSDSLELAEKGPSRFQAQLMRHLEPLDLPEPIAMQILSTVQRAPGGLERAVSRLQSHNDRLSIVTPEQLPISPLASGFSISLGYAVGGIIPLCPYFFAATVGAGFRWSLCLCLIALFTFGSCKSLALRGEGSRWRCVVEGLQMLVLGMLAAGAAVLCVMVVERKMS